MSLLKKRQSRLSLQDKVAIIQCLDNGISGASLAKTFNVNVATICDIKGKKNEIMDVAARLQNSLECEKKKSMKRARNLETEDAVYSWFIEMRKQGKNVSGPALCRKALELNKSLGGPSKFKASTAWLRNFKYRHGIKLTSTNREAFTGEAPTAGRFRESILKMVEEEGFCMDDIYNADEARISLKSVLCKSLAAQFEMGVNLEVHEEPVTVMVCGNASGQHSLPLYVVTKWANSNNFLNETSLPIKYKVQKYSWMDYKTFLDWFSQHFIPEVRLYRSVEGMTGKVLLLVDNSSCHSPLQEVNKIDDNFIVRFLPPTVVQPAHQGIIENMETMYVKDLLSRLSSNEENWIAFLNNLGVKDCCAILAKAWKRLPRNNFRKAWHKFWKALDEAVEQEQNRNKALLDSIPEVTETVVAEEWLEEEVAETSYETENAAGSELTQQIRNTPSHGEALTAFQTVIAWCEEQSECNPDELALLIWMKDLAEKKMQASI